MPDFYPHTYGCRLPAFRRHSPANKAYVQICNAIVHFIRTSIFTCCSTEKERHLQSLDAFSELFKFTLDVCAAGIHPGPRGAAYSVPIPILEGPALQ